MLITYYPNPDNQERVNSVMHRTRLYDLLNDHSYCRLIGIIADTGFGKTELIQGFLSYEGKNTLWCTFTGNDSIDDIIDELHESIKANPAINAIVFDNCSLIANELKFTNSLADLLSIAPSATIFMIGTALPKLPFAVMRAREEYFELTHADLALTREEIETYFNEFLSFSLHSHEIDIIYDKTQGWFISLQLINAYLRRNRIDNLDSLDLNFLSDVTDINDYFSYSLFENQSSDMQNFLLEISPLTELEPEIINELMNIDCAASYLDELKEYHGFAYISPASKKLRLHPLFRHYLYERQLSRDSSKCRSTHSKLVSIYENKRNYIMAFSHAVACNNYDAAIRLMKTISNRYNPIQLFNFIDGHLEEISPTLLFSNTTLFLQRCIPEDLMVELIQPLTDSLNNEIDSLRIANMQHRLGVIYFHLGNLQMAKELLEKSLTNSEVLRNVEVMAFNYQLLADCYLLMGDTTQALRCARNALYLSEQGRIDILQLHTLEVFSRIQLALGNMDQAVDYITQAVELAEDGWYELFWLYAAYSTISLAQNEVENAIKYARTAADIVSDSICGYDVAYTNFVLGQALIKQGNLTEAKSHLELAYAKSKFNALLHIDIIDALAQLEDSPKAQGRLVNERNSIASNYTHTNLLNSVLSDVASEVPKGNMKTQVININTFDNFSISYNSIPITIKRTSSLRLLQLLIVNRGRFVTKEYIIEQLFPDSSASAGTNNFNVALSVLRKTMDAAAGITDSNTSCIIREKNRYQLNGNLVIVDATTFESRYINLKKSESVNLNSWLELAALFSGTFMTEYPYEAFIDGERERLSSYQKDVVINIARAYVQKCDINKALNYYNKAFTLDVYDEDLYYEVIEMLLDNDMVGKAQAIGTEMKAHIETELGIPCHQQLQSMFDYYYKTKN